jgi:hypothetical protein
MIYVYHIGMPRKILLGREEEEGIVFNEVIINIRYVVLPKWLHLESNTILTDLKLPRELVSEFLGIKPFSTNNNTAIIPGKNRKEEIVYGKEVYKKRGLIERMFGKLKENRRLAVRYEKSDINFNFFHVF